MTMQNSKESLFCSGIASEGDCSSRNGETEAKASKYFYGDLFTGLSYTLFMPVYWQAMITDPAPGAEWVIFFLGSACVFHWIAWCRSSQRLSMFAFVLQTGCMSTMSLFEWPYRGQTTLMPQFFWSLVSMSGNVSMPVKPKTFWYLHSLTIASICTYYNRHVETSSTLLLFFCVTIVVIALHHPDAWQPKGSSKEQVGARIASIVLAGTYAYHLAIEIAKMATIPGYAASEGGNNIVKMGMLALLGVMATGAFTQQHDVGLDLACQVQKRGIKIAEQAEVLQMVTLALDASETAIAMLNMDSDIIWCNPAMQKLLKDAPHIPRNQHDSQPHPSLMHYLDIKPEAAECLQKAFEDTSTASRQVDLQLGSSHFSVAVSSFSLHGSEETKNRAGCKMVAFNDITELRAREKAEKAAERENLQKQAMSESMETLSHELRTPLQGIIGMTSLVLDNAQDISKEDAIEAMSTVMASSRLLLTLINNLLDIRKIDANMMDEFKLCPVPLASAMRDTANFCRPFAMVNDVNLELDLDGVRSENIAMRANPVRFQQVVVNLVSNAVKHSQPGSLVRIQTVVRTRAQVLAMKEKAYAVGLPVSMINGNPQDHFAVISVKDSGQGLPLAMKERVFGRFAQFHESCTQATGENKIAQPSGTGLGLNLCLKFVDRMHGNIWVNNRFGRGACFSFCLPLDETVVTESDEKCFHHVQSSEHDTSSIRIVDESMEAKRQACGVPSSEALRILVVDDTPINLKVLSRMIRKVSSLHKVTTVDSGFKALAILDVMTFDLVITDIQMPLMDGVELSETIQKSHTIKDKPVIVALTADTSEALHRRCALVGIASIMYKPVSASQLRDFLDEKLISLPTCDERLV